MGDLVGRTLRQKPHLRVVQHERKKSLEFIFTYEGSSFPSALRKENPILYSYLFEPREKGDWINALLEGYYSRFAPGKAQKRIRLALRFWLNRLLLNALNILVTNATSQGKQYDGNIKEEVEILKAFLKRKRRSPRSQHHQERDAIRFAKRHEELLPEAKKLKAFVKSQNEHDKKVLGQEAEKELRFKWLPYVGEALQHLPTVNKDRASTTSTLNGKWVPWQLSVGVIWCEEKSKRSPNTIYYKYIRRGNHLLKNGSPANKRAS